MDIRQAFLDFFAHKGHRVIPSAPLIPEDATLLFNNAGMVPFKSIFTGEVPIPETPRAASCQTCLRAGGKHNDLENVGHTARHHTFFEMLGNFSFGDYFKEEAIAYAWEFVTEVLELPKEKLWVTVHETDDEAEAIWQRHIDASRILRLGDKDNFWQMGDTGPCGPCSEIFFDQGAEQFGGPEDYLGGDGDRFLEIWNLVFMEFERSSDGTLQPLPRPSIDTGMGLERVMALKEGKSSNYDTELFMPIIKAVAEMTDTTYEYHCGASYRVIADHIRTAVFLLAQDVNFSNEGRGYVLRRILRRAVRHGYLLGLRKPFMYRLVDTLIKGMRSVYPYLEGKATSIKTQIELEEERFFRTITSGIALFNEELAQTKEVFSGKVAFRLYDTFGFPLDLTEDMLKERGIAIDYDRFEALMQAQKARAKASWKGSGDTVSEGDFKALLEQYGENHFSGYESLEGSAKILALLSEEFHQIDELSVGQQGWVLLDQTPFYAQGGGQSGDCGELIGLAAVKDTQKFFGLNLSHIETTQLLVPGQEVRVRVDAQRHEVEKHHSATHLLHAALSEVLGTHISQAGSMNDARRLRFDFSHPAAMTADEIALVEERVNYWIARGVGREVVEMPVEEAKASGAKALFGEKYAQSVRVVRFGEASVELCGGTHVENTATIGLFAIVKESGVSAGVRRIEAVCGQAAYDLFKRQRETVREATESLKSSDLGAGIERLKEQIKTLKCELQSAQHSSTKEWEVSSIGDINLIVESVEGGDIKTMIDEAKNRYPRVAIMLFQKKNQKVLIACGSKDTPIKAGEWIRAIAPIVGGGGGGRSDFAQAGGKDSSKIAVAIEEAKAYLANLLEGGN
jgi:alanyl-tRNA synthetase